MVIRKQTHSISILPVLTGLLLMTGYIGCAGSKDPASLQNRANSHYLKAWKVHQSDYKNHQRTVWLSVDRKVKKIAHKHIDWEYTFTFRYITHTMDYSFWLKKGVLNIGKRKYASEQSVDRYRIDNEIYCQSVDITLSLEEIYSIPLADTLYIALFGAHIQPWNVVLKKDDVDQIITFVRELEYME